MAADTIGNLLIYLGLDADKVKKELKKLRSSFQKLDDNVDKTSKSLKFIKKAGIAAFTGWGISKTIRSIVNAGREIDSMNQRLNTAAGGGKNAAQAWSFLVDEAGRLGINIESNVRGYSNLIAAAKESGVPLAEAQDIFKGVVEASTALQMSSDDTYGAIRAVVQIMSKGKAQAEELRGQLGERLPGAFGIASAAMGVSTQELSKMLDLGQVLAKDLLPAFGKELQKRFGEDAVEASKLLGSEINKLANTFLFLKKSVFEGEEGVSKKIAKIVRKFREAAEGAAMFFGVIEEPGGAGLTPAQKRVRDLGIEIDTLREKLQAGGMDTLLAHLLGFGAEFRKKQEEREHALILARSEAASLSAERAGDVADESIKTIEKMIKRWTDVKGAAEKIVFDIRPPEFLEMSEEEKAAIKFFKDKRKEEAKEKERILEIDKELLMTNQAIFDITDAQWRLWERQGLKITDERIKKEQELFDNYYGDMKFYDTMWNDFDGAATDAFDRIDSQSDLSAKAVAEHWKKMGESAREDFRYWGDEVIEVMDFTEERMRTGFRDGILKLMHGDLEDFGELWTSFWDDLRAKFASVLADMAVDWVVGFAEPYLGDIVGGIGGFIKDILPGLEEGKWKVGAEQAAILHPGEMVVPKEQAEGLREHHPGGFIGIEKGMYEQGMGFGDLFDESTLKGIFAKATTSAFLVGGLSAFSQAMQSDQIGVGDAVGALGDPESILGFFLSGVTATAKDYLGATSKWAGYGSKAGGALVTALGIGGGPMGLAIGAIANILGGVAGEGLGDMFNARENEELLDHLEDLGGWRGRAEAQRTGEVDALADAMFRLDEGYKDAISGPPSIGLPSDTINETWDDEGPSQEDIENFSDYFTGGFRKGTGIRGLPDTGLYAGHKGEIVLSPEQSAAMRSGGNGGGHQSITINLIMDGNMLGTAVADVAFRKQEVVEAIEAVVKKTTPVVGNVGGSATY